MITQDAFTKGKSLMETILDKMSGINKWRHNFFIDTMLLFMTIKGRINFFQMSRYSQSPEVRYRNQFKDKCDFASFNKLLIEDQCSKECIIGFDPSFVSKSGKHTEGIGNFYSGVAGKSKRGLELGCISIIDVKQNTAWHYEAIQTPNIKGKSKEDSLVDHYARIITERKDELQKINSIVVVDAYFTKKKFVDAMNNAGFEQISRLRSDANLKYLHEGSPTNGRGRPKMYGDKIKVKNIDKQIIKQVYKDDKMVIYEAIVYAIRLKRKIKLAYTEYLNYDGSVNNVILYYSTNLQRGSLQIVQYYKARYQMEFNFRDAKQHTGLENCQARSEEKLYNHFNFSLTAVSLAKAILRQDMDKEAAMSYSIADIKTELFNNFLLERIFCNYQIDPKLKENHLLRRYILNIGKIAA
jgi:hypothetical protein